MAQFLIELLGEGLNEDDKGLEIDGDVFDSNHPIVLFDLKGEGPLLYGLRIEAVFSQRIIVFSELELLFINQDILLLLMGDREDRVGFVRHIHHAHHLH